MEKTPLRNALHAAFYQYREVESDSHIYVLLDPNHPVAPYHPLQPEQLAKREAPRTTEIVLRPDLAHEPQVCPRLVQLYRAGEHGYVDEALVDLTIECAEQRCASVNGAYVSAWIVSPAEPSRIAKHLASAGVVFDLGKGKQRYVPLFEPARTALVIANMPPAPQRSWLSPAKHWLYVDAAGMLQILDTPAETLWQPLRLAPEHFAAMSRLDQARFVLMALVNSGAVPEHQPEMAIDHAVKDAHEQGLMQTEDVVFFALNHFTLGERWCSHPAARNAIKQAASGVLRLTTAMQALSDDVLDSIAEHARGGSMH